ncbi:3-hydroxyacyl-[acyl-carrier-protein] dehydratase FabZ [Candidatus Methylacidiphilum fumarolicum]|nr:bifunctional UDP-3-O-[3-hydroxymyristoyl] N-acetylglucosamine deacetylase/3-hydroxyacyl-ACP dehydratase [Candidatus Methylacidiphilum fumarolicum]TFE73338.1 3-hydroxyacyl-[acyl-carrier-protein] dehydratase FabZ [Candidatus Methylacidiphilum fumarolicum]TFE74119.1 3-hydroxyacyl-[acyl-carrier-protein] dehydratase FabZ [Candidatus Methylacidiphilum fumarolicum]
MIMQRTIREPVSVEGLSLHTGNPVRIVIKPAEADSGYVFKRVDLPDEPTVQVSVDNVRQTERATTIGEGNVKVHTVEHVLAALSGCGVDNALIELNANEPPIGDGSGMFLVNEILKVGTVEQDKAVSFFELREPVWVEGEDGAYIAAWPDQNFSISCTHVSHTGLFTQYFSWKYDIKSFVTEIAPARTFVFYEELVPLIEKGLIKGGSLDNAIVIRGEAVYSQQPLRFENEFVRHKIFDMIGDFALFPKRLKARVVAARPSHFLNVKFIREIQKAYKNYLSHLMPVENIPVGEGALDINEVMKILPHRYPFLMLDRVLGFQDDVKAIGQKAVTMNEAYFQGHFPGHPIMPGVLQIEAMAQLASILLLRKAGNAGKLGYFMSADKVKFRKPVMPGDTLIIEVEMTKARGKIGKAFGKCYVNKETVCEGELLFALVDG